MAKELHPELQTDPFEALRRAPLLRGLTDVGVRILAQVAQRRAIGRGAYVFRSGEPASALLIIARGSVQLLPREGGAPIFEAGVGEALSGFALLGGGDHLLSALAGAEVELFEITIAAFRRLSQEKPQATMKLVLALAADLGARVQDARVPLREFLLWQLSRRG